jgi:hypothetical protein
MLTVVTLLAFIASTPTPAVAQRIGNCELGRPDLNGHFIQTRTTLFLSRHGLYIEPPPRCDNERDGHAEAFLAGYGGPAVNFEGDPATLKALRPFWGRESAVKEVCVVLEGQLVVLDDIKGYNVNGILRGWGFGPTGALKSAVVIKRLLKLSPSPCKP